jgi:hypothetical protein
VSRSGPSSNDISVTTGGITLLGVMLSIGVTVGLGISGDWWLRLAVGSATTLVLVVAVKLGTSTGRGPLARFALWTIGYDEDGERSGR